MSKELLRTAQYLTERSEGSTPSDLCAALSTTYYALFETLAKLTADLFIGLEGPERAERAWMHTYRSLTHTRIATRCGKSTIQEFPPDIIDFATFFLDMQYKRERSDYHFGHTPNLGAVQTDIARANLKIDRLLSVPEKDQRAFCAFVLLDRDRHEDEPKNIGKPKKVTWFFTL